MKAVVKMTVPAVARLPGTRAANVRLSRDAGNHIEPLTDADAFQTLLMHAYLSGDAARRARTVALVKRVVRAAGFYSLGCNMSPEAAVVAHDGMNADF